LQVDPQILLGSTLRPVKYEVRSRERWRC
jgi:hypothetical protein